MEKRQQQKQARAANLLDALFGTKPEEKEIDVNQFMVSAASPNQTEKDHRKLPISHCEKETNESARLMQLLTKAAASSAEPVATETQLGPLVEAEAAPSEKTRIPPTSPLLSVPKPRATPEALGHLLATAPAGTAVAAAAGEQLLKQLLFAHPPTASPAPIEPVAAAAAAEIKTGSGHQQPQQPQQQKKAAKKQTNRNVSAAESGKVRGKQGSPKPPQTPSTDSRAKARTPQSSAKQSPPKSAKKQNKTPTAGTTPPPAGAGERYAWSSFQMSPDPKALPPPPMFDDGSPPPMASGAREGTVGHTEQSGLTPSMARESILALLQPEATLPGCALAEVTSKGAGEKITKKQRQRPDQKGISPQKSIPTLMKQQQTAKTVCRQQKQTSNRKQNVTVKHQESKTTKNKKKLQQSRISDSRKQEQKILYILQRNSSTGASTSHNNNKQHHGQHVEKPSDAANSLRQLLKI